MKSRQCGAFLMARALLPTAGREHVDGSASLNSRSLFLQAAIKFHVKLTHRPTRPLADLAETACGFLACLVLAWATSTAQAAIYKCPGADSKVAFSDQPCVADRTAATRAAQAQAAIRAENARNESRQKQSIVDEECKEKRRAIAERRPRLSNLSGEDRKAFAAVESDVARGGR